jgi:hypothetical protein
MDFFGDFLRGLPARPYCADCLSMFYEKPVPVIREHLVQLGIGPDMDNCANCDRSCETFRCPPTKE